MRRARFVLAAVLGLMLVGCAGGSSLAAIVAGLVLLAGVSACADDAGECSGQWERGCRDGQMVDLCCPANTACNYGWAVECNGACISMWETCPDLDASGDVGDAPSEVDDEVDDCPHWDRACDHGVIVDICCPGIPCDQAADLVDCGGGTCVTVPEMCPR